MNSAEAERRRSDEEFRAVSTESWITPMMNPTATTCMETSSEMPNREHAIGIRSREPPATPDAPQADRAARRLRMIAVGIST